MAGLHHHLLAYFCHFGEVFGIKLALASPVMHLLSSHRAKFETISEYHQIYKLDKLKK